MQKFLIALPLVLFLVATREAVAMDVPVYQAEVLEQFETFDARQGIAVDLHSFYAVNNYRITRHDRKTGRALLQWDGGSDETGPLVHLDSGVVWQGRLYASHSNYPGWPMTSSVEVWDVQSMEHLESHSFGIALGSMTWLDRHAGYWWAGFGNYDKVQKGQSQPYGETRHTQVVRMDDDFRVLEQWTLPAAIQQRIRPMSNSGGSWGPDNLLYLTGHDLPEIYVLRVPAHGAELDWLATIAAPPVHGQGIAWDRTATRRELWGIRKKDRLVFRMLVPEIPVAGAVRSASFLRPPGQFSRD